MLNLNLESKSHQQSTLETDVLIIGAGPAGLTAAIYTTRANLKTTIVHSEHGSQLEIEHPIKNYPGFESISGNELLSKIRTQAEKNGATFIPLEVVQLNLNNRTKFITMRDGSIIATQSVIFSIGRGKRKKGIPGEKRLFGHGISYCSSCDGPLYKEHRVIVIGNPHNNETIDDISLLHEMGCKVIVLTEESISTQLQSLVDKNIQVIEEVRVKEISGLERVESVLIEHFSGEEETIHTKAVFLFGTISPATLIAQAGIIESKIGCISTNHNCKTNIEGVYAAGDITCSGFQAVIAAGQGARAAMQVIKYVRRLKRNS